MVNAEFFDALEQLEKEKGIPVDYMLDRVGQALITAYKRDNDGMTDNVYVEPDREQEDHSHVCPQDGCQGGGSVRAVRGDHSRGGCRVQEQPAW